MQRIPLTRPPWQREEAARTAAHFEEDAIFLPQGSEIQGRPVIQSWLEGWLGAVQIDRFDVTTRDVRVAGETAIEVGAYEMTWAMPGEDAMVDSGKYVMVWSRGEEGQWRILRDIFNSNTR
jgi:uncharacterized protein (TIGR02246 family)